MIRVRFAPVLAGSVFVSSARIALANDLFARRNNGEMLLRLDDLGRDRLGLTRSHPKSGCLSGRLASGVDPTSDDRAVDTRRADPVPIEQIVQDLRWLGIEWQASFRQSERLELYQNAIERLKRDKRLYPCFESEEELKAKQAFRRRHNQPTIYDRGMLSLTEKQRRDAEAGGKSAHWRFKLPDRSVAWDDLVLGPRSAALSAVSDPVLVRADGQPTPLLAGVVDDVEYGTTHIIRGDDSAGNTAVQIALFDVLGGGQVRFGHLPGLRSGGPARSGGRRAEDPAIRGLRKDGVEPGAIVACMTGLAAGRMLALDDLAKQFEIASIAACRFDITRLLAVNRRLLSELDFPAVADRLPEGATERFWQAIRGHVELLKDARDWWDVVAGTIRHPVLEGQRDLLLRAEALLPPEPWDDAVWTGWIRAVETSTGRSGDAVVAPLRLALTGESSGPDLARLLPLIGRERASKRLIVAAADTNPC